MYPMPEYQKEAVSKYLSQQGVGIPNASYFNKNGRGLFQDFSLITHFSKAYPDIAALGEDYQVVINGNMEHDQGTSASTPTIAGIVSLLNDVRLRAGKKPMGFLNPWLYSQAGPTTGAFYDITSGANTQTPCTEGYPATPGWDAISGWGVPNFAVLKKLALSK